MSQSKEVVAPSFFSTIAAMYLQQLAARPLPTKALTSGTLNFIGDQLAQTVEGRKTRDFVRSLKFASFGTFISSPMLHFWYKFLAWAFEGKEGLHIILIKLFIDQVIFSPIFFVVYYIYMAIWNGNMAEVPQKIQNELIPVSIDSAKVWVPVQYVNFKFVPDHLKVLFGNVIALGWNTYFSVISNKKKNSKQN